LSVIYVSEHTVAIDDAGIVIRGIGKYSGDIGRRNFDPKTMTLSRAAENTEGHPANDPGRRDPWIDISDDQIAFELSAPRVASQNRGHWLATIRIWLRAGTGNINAVLTT